MTTTEGSAPQVPAGWYSDPDWPDTERYWDGEVWTDQRRQESAHAPTATPRSAAAPSVSSGSTQPAVWVAAVCAGLVAIGSLSPWATTALVSQTGVSGGDGWLTIILAVLAAVALGFYVSEAGPGRALGVAVCGGLAVLLGVVELVNFESQTTRIFGREADIISAGWGLYLVIAAGAGLVVAGMLLRAGAPRR